MQRFIYSILLVLLCAVNGIAQEFSYVYIQGDKETPFYVKYEDQMLPRYGRNYHLISQLVGGAINIQILFQQNQYPPQKFTILVPDEGFRSFLLIKKNGAFSLYDIQQGFYLQPGNTEEEDKLPGSTGKMVAYIPPPVTTTSKPVASTIKQTEERNPQFIEKVELNAPKVTQQPVVPQDEEPTVIKQETPTPAEQKIIKTYRTVKNSDCPAAMSDREFADLNEKVLSKSESSRLKYLLGKMNECYNVAQVRALAEILSNDPERYTFLKRVYPRTVDQVQFPPLEELLQAQEWKGYFRLILPQQ